MYSVVSAPMHSTCLHIQSAFRIPFYHIRIAILFCSRAIGRGINIQKVATGTTMWNVDSVAVAAMFTGSRKGKWYVGTVWS